MPGLRIKSRFIFSPFLESITKPKMTSIKTFGLPLPTFVRTSFAGMTEGDGQFCYKLLINTQPVNHVKIKKQCLEFGSS